MEILSETEKKVVNMEVDMTEKEISLLINYAMDNISQEEMDKLLLNWAFVNIIEKQVATMMPPKEGN